MTAEVKEKQKIIQEVSANLTTQLKGLDTKIERATAKVDRLTIQRNHVATLLEKVNRVRVEE